MASNSTDDVSSGPNNSALEDTFSPSLLSPSSHKGKKATFSDLKTNENTFSQVSTSENSSINSTFDTSWTLFKDGKWIISSPPPPTEFAKANFKTADKKKLIANQALACFKSMPTSLVKLLGAISSDSQAPMDKRYSFAVHIVKNWNNRNGKSSRQFFNLTISLLLVATHQLPNCVDDHDQRKIVPTSSLVELWLAVFDVFGDTSLLDIVFTMTDNPFPITSHGQDLQIYIPNDVPTSASAILTIAHDPIRSLSSKLSITQTDSNAWQQAIEKTIQTPENSRTDTDEELLSISILLAACDPENLPGWMDDRLIINQISSLWLASNKTYGSFWAHKLAKTADLSPVIDHMEGITRTPQSPDMQHGKHTRHGSEDSAKSDIMGRDTQSNASTPDKSTNSKKARNTGTPERFQLEKEDRRKLFPPKFSPNDKSTRGSPTKKSTEVFFPVMAIQAPKGRVKKPSSSVTALPKFQTYLTTSINISVEHISEFGPRLNETVDALKQIWRSLIETEPGKTAIACFLDPLDPNSKLLRHPNDFPTRSNVIRNTYTQEIAMAWAPQSYTDVNFLLVHATPIDKLLEHRQVVAKLEELNSFLVPDKMQCPRRFYLGNLLGVIVSESSLIRIADQLKSLAAFQAAGVTNIMFDVRLHRVSQRLQKEEARVKDIHVWVDETFKIEARQLFRSMFPSKPRPRGSYPLGIQYRFVDEVISGTRMISPNKLKVAVNLRSKQKAFQESILTFSYPHIKNLFAAHPSTPSLTLARVVMTMKSTNYPDKFLFHAVEQEHLHGMTLFHFSSIHEKEVNGMISGLPLVCEGFYGSAIARAWFTSTVWHSISDQEFHKVLDEDGNTQGGYLAYKTTDPEFDMIEDWELDTEYTPEELLIEEDDTVPIANIDLTELDHARSHILEDDGMSTRTTGSGLSQAAALVYKLPASVPTDASTEATPNSALTSQSDGENLTLSIRNLLLKAQFSDPDDNERAQQLLHSSAAGRDL